MIESGTALPRWTIDDVELARIHVLALILGDPNVIHIDAEAVRRMGLGRAQVNQGPANIAYLVNMLATAFPQGRLRSLECRLLGTVFAGDAVRAGGDVTALLTPATDGQPSAVRCAVWLERTATGRHVIEGTAEVELPVS
jgi:3-hydroxybutyryl-CoA dehydratase